MAGRKTIMVDGGVWNKVEELKHDACLRSSSDAIEAAVDIAASDKYYAGVMAQYDGNEEIAYVVESLGKTEDEAVRNLLIFEQDSVFGDLRAEDIPTADETDISKPGRFIVECTKRLYHAGKLFADPEEWPASLESPILNSLFTCTITKSKNGSLIADSEEGNSKKYFVLVELLDDKKTARIVNYSTSSIELHEEMVYETYSPYEESENKYDNYNACKYKIYPCTPRLYAECIGMKFQSRRRLIFAARLDGNLADVPMFEAFYGCRKGEFNEKTMDLDEFIDTTPEGKYYAVLAEDKDKTYFVLNAADTANKASLPIKSSSPIQYNDIGDGEHFVYETNIPVWSDVNENGERVGKYDLDEKTSVNLVLVECTKDLYCKFIMAEAKLKVPCTIEEENGVKIAKYCESSKQSTKEKSPETATKTAPAKKAPAKKTGGRK